MAAVGACAGFGAICGSSLATAATMGQIALPELKKHGYSGALATGTLAAGGTLGILIPPSVILVIYAILTEQNIAKLFLTAMIPGILAAVGYIITIAIVVRLRPEEAGKPYPRVPYAERFRLLLEDLAGSRSSSSSSSAASISAGSPPPKPPPSAPPAPASSRWSTAASPARSSSTRSSRWPRPPR